MGLARVDWTEIPVKTPCDTEHMPVGNDVLTDPVGVRDMMENNVDDDYYYLITPRRLPPSPLLLLAVIIIIITKLLIYVVIQ